MANELKTKQVVCNLTQEFPDMKGFSRSNLFYIKKWFLFYNSNSAIVQQLVGQLPQANKEGKNEIVQQPVASTEMVQQLVGQIGQQPVCPNAFVFCYHSLGASPTNYY